MHCRRAFPGLVLASLFLAACTSSQRRADVPPPKVSRSAANQATTIDELDQLNRGFADNYFMAIGAAVDSIKKDNPDPNQRRIAHRIKLNGVLALNDIATANDPYSETLDLAVVITLQSKVWIEEGRATQMFGERGAPLIRSLNVMRREAWDIAARVMTQDQLESLDYIILEWRHDHPNIDQVEFVKFDNFATARAASLLADLKGGGGLLAPSSETNAELHEYRRLAERAFWYSKRAPSIAALQAEAATGEILTAPEISALLATIDRASLTAQEASRTIQELPKTIATERQAVFNELDVRDQQITRLYGSTRSLLTDGQALVSEADKLSGNLQSTLVALQSALQTADVVVGKFYTPGPTTTPGKPFDINEYGNVADKINGIVAGLNQLANTADKSTRAGPWGQALQDLSDATDRRVERAFQRIYVSIGLVLAAAVIFLALFRFLPRRQAPGR